MHKQVKWKGCHMGDKCYEKKDNLEQRMAPSQGVVGEVLTAQVTFV